MERPKVLIVEDEMLLARDLRQTLVRQGYHVVQSNGTGEDAIKQASHERPDLVLMDIQLRGEMEGTEAAAEISRQFNIPIVYLTAYADDDTLKRARITAPYGYILKPYEERELFTNIEIALYKHKMEAKLRESEERHRSLTNDVLNTSRVGIMILDSQFKIIWTNAAAATYLSFDRDEAQGNDRRQMVGEYIKYLFEYPDEFEDKSLSACNDDAHIERFECHILPSVERPERWLEYWSQPITSGLYNGGRIEHYYDITARKLSEQALQRSEAQLLQAHKMEMVGTLAGGVAHDFNNILTTVLISADLAMNAANEGRNTKQEIADIKAAALKAADLTNQLLSFSKKQVLKRQALDINVTIADLLRMLRRVVGEDVEVIADLKSKLRCVWADPAQLQQVLMNLVINARDAMPSGGPLLLSTKDLLDPEDSRHPEYGKRQIQILIKDSGVGISEEVKRHIFDPFFTTKEVGKGTGLGLSVVYGIISQHGGTIECDSAPGHGTCFAITLPAAEIDDHELIEQHQSEPVVCGNREIILLVEDEDHVRHVAAMLLKRLHYKVISARNGVEALDIIRRSPSEIDLVILDVVMPQKSGPEVYLEMQRFIPEVPVIFVTGYDIEDQLAEIAFDDEDKIGMLQKPYTQAELANKVHEFIAVMAS